MEKERQIVRNSTGVIFSVANVIVMLASLAAAIYFMYLYNSGETSFPNNEVDLVMRYLGFTIAPLFFLRSDEDRVYVYLATGCFLVACLPHLYIHFRALLQPSFLAGNPDKMKFLPLIFPPALRIVCELIYCWRVGDIYYSFAGLSAIVSITYSYGIVYTNYSVDDDNLRKDFCGFQQKNNKPWKYEELTLPK